MKEIKTDSYFVTICESNNKKFIKRRIRKGIKAYPRTIPIHKTLKLLDNYNIPHPKYLRRTFNFVYEEFIESDNTNKNDTLDTLIKYLIEMSNINPNKIKKYIKWNNNTEYLLFLINNLKTVLNNQNKDISKLNSFKYELDNNRRMSFIHGDIHNKNLIYHNNSLYLIDWELSTYGDIAYELAMMFILMNYDDLIKEKIIDNISNSFKCDKEKLIRDINIYIEFEHLRKELLSN